MKLGPFSFATLAQVRAALPHGSAVRLRLAPPYRRTEIKEARLRLANCGGIASNSKQRLIGKAQPYRIGERQSRRRHVST
jgi:hypothetical protein